MTTVFDVTDGTPQTHALVIGVGRYPYCADTAGWPAPLRAMARTLTTLSSSARSALRVADFLLTEQTGNAVAPLGSVELLVSDVTGLDTAVAACAAPMRTAGTFDAPTFDAVCAGFDRWLTRCDGNADNVALLFFSGHGWSGNRHTLLLEDVGAAPNRFLDNAVDFSRTYLAMADCRARTQCFFIDTCRDLPSEVLNDFGMAARPLLSSGFTQSRREAPIYWATAPGDNAYGEPGGITFFTRAMLRALGGLAAQKPGFGKPWTVTTGKISPVIDALLAFDSRPGIPHQRAYAGGSMTGNAGIRALSGPPDVPFRIGLEPREALGAAEFRIVRCQDQAEVRSRPPRPSLWEDQAPSDHYDWHARFAAGEYRDSRADFTLLPPCMTGDIEVSGS